MSLLTVRVDCDRDGWAIAVPDGSARLTCRTLEDATRLARRCAEDKGPCEMIVCDAYHRVLYREMVSRVPDGVEASLN